jgi:biotin transport system substrate-specific component
MKNQKLQNMTFAALMTALIAVLSQIAIPLPSGVPITLQTLAVALCGYLLGLNGTISVLIYILLGIIGAPVFTYMRGGIHHIFGSPTGGFIIGFLFLALLCGISELLFIKTRKKFIFLLFGAVGVILCHFSGVIHYSIVAKLTFKTAFIAASLPYLLKDLLSVAAAYFLSIQIKNRIQKTKI